MIADECKKLRLQLQEVAKAEEREDIVERLGERHKELEELRDTVLPITEALNVLTNRTLLVGSLDATKAFERVRKVREALQSDPLSITKGRDFTNMRSALQKFAIESQKVIEATWEQFLPRAKPNIDTNQIAQAEQQDAFRTKAIQLKNRAKHAESLSKRAPFTEEAFQELETTWQEVRNLIEDLPAVANDPTVREFLKAANSRNGAALELLTDEVRQWLAENSSADKYRIINM